jgi:hypothetical protein
LGLLAGLQASADAENIAQEKERQANHRAYAERISELTSRLENFIAEELVKKAGQDESPEARRYLLHDLDGDKQDDLLLITAFGLINGGNYSQSELLVALSSDSPKVHRLIVGGRGQRAAENFTKSQDLRHVFLGLKVWAKTDAECCPSLASSAQVRFAHGNLELVELDSIKRRN